MRVSQFIEQSHLASSIEELVGMFLDVLHELNYTYYCCYTLDGLAPDTDAKVGKAHALHYSEDYVRTYREKNFLAHDPMFKLLCRARGPFTWSQIRQLPLTPRQKAVMESRNGMDGVGVPLQSADPSLIGMNVISADSSAVQNNTSLSRLFAACNQFQLQRARILGREQEFVLPDIHLTPREQEMLEWAAQGKSNSVIGEILGISEKTVEFHLKSVFAKLDVSSRTSAVLKAAHWRLINMQKLV